jgi:hypothetical protein
MISADQYASDMYKTVQGFDVNGENLLAINLLSQSQVQNGVHGDLLEIGLFHGRTAVMLGLLRRPGERFVGIDAFGSSESIQHQDRQVDLDYYGDGKAIRKGFDQNWQKFILSASDDPDAKPILIEKDSRSVSQKELQSATSGVRLFSLDGGHSEISTYHDLELAESVVKDGGILILDDYFLEDCPAVSVGAMRYFLTTESKFVPFLIFCGRVFFTTADYVQAYQETILSGGITRWVRFGEFLGQPMICLIEREMRNKERFDAEAAEWRRCQENYLAQRI